MSRHQRTRKIVSPPRFGGYKPYGCNNDENLPIELLYEEYEAIKLADYKHMKHQEAAILMEVSRATFARIYENARRKIALALVETKEIVTVAGNSYADKTWYMCTVCHNRYTLATNNKSAACPKCNSTNIEIIVKDQ